MRITSGGSRLHRAAGIAAAATAVVLSVAAPALAAPGSTPPDAPAPEKTGTIEGHVWQDLNSDGQQKGEPALSDVNVTVFQVADGKSVLLTGDELAGGKGTFAFDGLPVGKYVIGVQATTKAGTWALTKANTGADATDSDFTLQWPSAAPLPSLPGAPKKAAATKATKADVGFSAVVEVTASAPVVVDAGFAKPGTPASPVPSPSAPTPSAPPTPGNGGTLPVTGSTASAAAGAGAVLLAGGIGLVALGRRRRVTGTK